MREAYGALLALWQSERASDGAVRAAMSEIAADEAGHAELAFDVSARISTQLNEAARERLQQSVRAAARELRAETARSPSAELVSVLGLPTSQQAGALLDALTRSIVNA